MSSQEDEITVLIFPSPSLSQLKNVSKVVDSHFSSLPQDRKACKTRQAIFCLRRGLPLFTASFLGQKQKANSEPLSWYKAENESFGLPHVVIIILPKRNLTLTMPYINYRELCQWLLSPQLLLPSSPNHLSILNTISFSPSVYKFSV